MRKTNPFRPNSPVHSGMFVGRLAEVDALEAALRQTRASRPKNILITGERGIGKTSLLDYVRAIASGKIPLGELTLNFLVVSADIESTTTQAGLIRRIQLDIERQLATSEKARSFLAEAWQSLKRVEAGGLKLRDQADDAHPETLLDEFVTSLAKTTKRVSSRSDGSPFGAVFDGVVLILDEADNASDALSLGAFIKLLLERLQRQGCENVAAILAGLPDIRNVLQGSHESSLRVFDELKLGRLSGKEIVRVVARGIDEANQLNVRQTRVEPAAEETLAALSEGYPHFIQQFSYSAFEADTDDLISDQDVWNGALGPRGALELIGDRYYRTSFYNKIQKESYRQVLRIMADGFDAWISKEQIRAKFDGNEATLANALKALRDRKIILSKEGARGVYRLQHKGFALWIKLYTTDPRKVQAELKVDPGVRNGEGTASEQKSDRSRPSASPERET